MQTKNDVVDRFFLVARARVIELAAFFDRVERSEGELADEQRAKTERLRKGLEMLLDSEAQKAKRTHMLFSLPSDANWRTKLIDSQP